MHRVIIDRIEGKYAVLQYKDGTEIIYPLSKLPKNIKEGSALKLNISTEKPLRKPISNIKKRLKQR